jgi:hypothetical protein
MHNDDYNYNIYMGQNLSFGGASINCSEHNNYVSHLQIIHLLELGLICNKLNPCTTLYKEDNLRFFSFD